MQEKWSLRAILLLGFLFSGVPQSHVSRTVSVQIPIHMKSVWFQVPGAITISIYGLNQLSLCQVSPPCHRPAPVLAPLFCMLGWSYFEISPGPVCHSVTFLITSEGCCAWHGNEALFVSAAALLSVCPISSCSLGARIVVAQPWRASQSKQLTYYSRGFLKTDLHLFQVLSCFVYCVFFFFSQHTKTIYEHRSRALPVWPVCVCPDYYAHVYNFLNIYKRGWTQWHPLESVLGREMTLLEGINSLLNLGAGMVYFPPELLKNMIFCLLLNWLLFGFKLLWNVS